MTLNQEISRIYLFFKEFLMFRQNQKKRQGISAFCLLSASLPVRALFIISIGITSALASQFTYQSHDSILETVKNYIHEKTEKSLGDEGEITVNRLDSRLLLQKCADPLTAFSSSGEQFIGHISVGIRCDIPKPWTIYVRAHIKAYSDVLVTTRAIKRGEHLTTADITLAKRDLSSLPSHYLNQLEQANGLVVKRSIQRGTVLTSRSLEAPKLVRRGQKISLLAERNGIQVRSKGKSLSDGVSGQRVKVKNLSSNRIIEGIVIDEGTVKVIM